MDMADMQSVYGALETAGTRNGKLPLRIPAVIALAVFYSPKCMATTGDLKYFASTRERRLGGFLDNDDRFERMIRYASERANCIVAPEPEDCFVRITPRTRVWTIDLALAPDYIISLLDCILEGSNETILHLYYPDSEFEHGMPSAGRVVEEVRQRLGNYRASVSVASVICRLNIQRFLANRAKPAVFDSRAEAPVVTKVKCNAITIAALAFVFISYRTGECVLTGACVEEFVQLRSSRLDDPCSKLIHSWSRKMPNCVGQCKAFRRVSLSGRTPFRLEKGCAWAMWLHCVPAETKSVLESIAKGDDDTLSCLYLTDAELGSGIDYRYLSKDAVKQYTPCKLRMYESVAS